MKRIFVLIAFVLIILSPTMAWAQLGDTKLSLGYELTSGLNGELTYGLNLGIGAEIEESTEVRLDFLYQSYQGTTWDASKDIWEAHGKSISNADAMLLGLILSLRGYSDAFLAYGVRPYVSFGLGYYQTKWEDIHPEDGTRRGWGLVPGLGLEYMFTNRVGVGADLKYHMATTKLGSFRFTSTFLNLIYKL